jgi:hypothetical protein
MRRLAQGDLQDPNDLTVAYNALIENADYRLATTSSTAAEETVTSRISTAEAAFASLR